MSIEPAMESIDVQKPDVSVPVPRSWWARFLYGVYVLVMPGVAFWATELFKPEWQNGEFSSYIILLLSPNAALLFFPLLLFSVLCYLLLLTDLARYSTQFVIRFGIYTGVLLALQFSLISGIYFFNTNPSFLLVLLLWVSPILAARIYAWAVARWGVKKVIIFLVTVLVVAYVAIAVLNSMIFSPLLFLLVVLTIAAPFWCFLIFFRVATWFYKNSETTITLPRGFGLTAWFGASAIAWRYAILKMYELYAALPPQPPPDCYIATAAAQGHPEIVGSRIILCPDGKSLFVNRQLQILKCAELALIAVQPRIHKIVRRIYDVVGKSLAGRIKNPFTADLAYLLLKPCEWLATFVLELLVPEIEQIANKIYTK